MQLAVPRLRSAAALRGFREAMTACNHDLAAWRARERPPPAQTAALDANGGAGWELASSLLRPRRIEARRVLVNKADANVGFLVGLILGAGELAVAAAPHRGASASSHKAGANVGFLVGLLSCAACSQAWPPGVRASARRPCRLNVP